jgi:transposase
MPVLRRYDLADQEWEAIESLLPLPHGHRPIDNRAFLNAVSWILHTGSPWRDLPERYGPWERTYRRFTRWKKRGIWEQVFKALGRKADFSKVMMDSTTIKAHRSAQGQKKISPAD